MQNIFKNKYICIFLLRKIPKFNTSVAKRVKGFFSLARGMWENSGKTVVSDSIPVLRESELPSERTRITKTNLHRFFSRMANSGANISQICVKVFLNITEEDYKKLKSKLQIENWSGKTVHSVYQDFHAKVKSFNLTCILADQANSEVG